MAIIPRYQRMRRRDWKDPFSWFDWYFMATSVTAQEQYARLASDNTIRLASDGTVRVTS